MSAPGASLVRIADVGFYVTCLRRLDEGWYVAILSEPVRGKRLSEKNAVAPTLGAALAECADWAAAEAA